jgi:hypothetical protein
MAKFGFRGILFLSLTYHRKCNEFVTKFGTFNDPQDLEDQIQTVLKSDASGVAIN